MNVAAYSSYEYPTDMSGQGKITEINVVDVEKRRHPSKHYVSRPRGIMLFWVVTHRTSLKVHM